MDRFAATDEKEVENMLENKNSKNTYIAGYCVYSWISCISLKKKEKKKRKKKIVPLFTKIYCVLLTLYI